MLASGIKNAILVLLVVCIIHFLIKNAILEKRKEAFKVPQVTEAECKKEATEKQALCENDLLDYVYNDDVDLSKFFTPMSCKLDTTPVPPVCDPEFTKPPETPNKLGTQCNPTQHDVNLVLTEYQDENAMNGGSLYDNLSAFNTDTLSYQNYTCANT